MGPLYLFHEVLFLELFPSLQALLDLAKLFQTHIHSQFVVFHISWLPTLFGSNSIEKFVIRFVWVGMFLINLKL